MIRIATTKPKWKLITSINSCQFKRYTANINNANSVSTDPNYNPDQLYKRPNSPRLGTFLMKYGSDLTDSMKHQQWDPMVGRQQEMERVVQILSRRTKNNPCLIGDAGVGKTSIVEGLAYRIHTGNCPVVFRDKVIISLDLPSMLAGKCYVFVRHICMYIKLCVTVYIYHKYIVGAKFRGEFEDRLKGTVPISMFLFVFLFCFVCYICVFSLS